MEIRSTTCLIAGGGPAGMMLGYLLARAGIDVTVLEKHKDFLRDFRGDTVHPSTLQIMKELGLLAEFLTLPHAKVTQATADFGDRHMVIGDFSRVKTACKFIALMPQWDFLNFIAQKANALPNFHLLMETEAKDLIGKGYKILAGTTDSGVALQMAPLAAQNRVLFIDGPAATDAITGANKYTFRSGRQSYQDIMTAGSLLSGAKGKKVLVLAQNSAFGQDNVTAVKQVLGAQGAKISSVLAPPSADDLTPCARQVKALPVNDVDKATILNGMAQKLLAGVN